MDGTAFPFDEYCERTGAAPTGANTLERLAELQLAQLRAIPFENLDIQLGRGINLDPLHVLNKLVRSRRGGYCFELNGLFLRALHSVGFSARALLARVHVSGAPSARTHQVTLVDVGDRQWMVDVGFGGQCPQVPMPLEPDTETDNFGTPYRLREHELGFMLQNRSGDEWLDLYSFDLTPVVAADIQCGNHFTATHPASFFTTSRIASLPYEGGRTTLFNFTCTATRDGEVHQEEFPDAPEFLDALERVFGIELDAEYPELAAIAAPGGERGA
jgi:N-hydroxyarylamine O-acetyltransferase